VLRLIITTQEGYDEATSEFVSESSTVLELEHSLVSLSKWESEWEISFLDTEGKTDEHVMSYIRCMYLGEEFPENIWPKMKQEHFDQINNYINKKMTATTFPGSRQEPQREIVTAELIYYWMIALEVPFECQYWHLGRLLTLIRVCNVKNAKPEKKSWRQQADDRRAENERRRRQLGTRG
jgi:hypothetical protein